MTNTNTTENTNNIIDIARASEAAAPVRALRAPRTPYHELGALDTRAGALRVPTWAQHRSVYRSAGRTLYLVETDRLDEAKRDLDALSRHGWEVRIDVDGDRTDGAANITLSRQAA